MENRGRISATLTNKQSLGGKVKLKMLKGEDGFSPTIFTTSTSKGTTVTVTDAEGDHSFVVLNGEKGDPGYTPIKGVDYFDGEKGDPGYTPVKGVDYFDGEKGDPGYTPVKGVDYFDGAKGDPGDDYVLTEADKAEIAGMVDAPVEDVQINGTSIVSDGVAEIPIATNSMFGVTKGNINQGIGVDSVSKNLYISQASESQTKAGTSVYKPITPANQHSSTFYGLAKAAGSDEKNSTLPVGQYTDEAKIAIQKMLGIYEPPFELIEDFTLTEEGRFDKTTEPDGTLYNFRGVFIHVFYAANLQTASTGYGRYLCDDSDGTHINAETGKYTAQTNTYAKFIYIMRNGAMAIAVYSRVASTGGTMSWQHKDNSGIKFDFKNIRRIYMNAADVEPAGTRIQIYAQRAY